MVANTTATTRRTMAAMIAYSSKTARAMITNPVRTPRRRSFRRRSSIVPIRLPTSSAELDPDGRCAACALMTVGTRRWIAESPTR